MRLILEGKLQYPQKKDRGTLVKIDPKTGKYTVFATGLRTPNGLALNEKGEIFISDNQGDFCLFQKLLIYKKIIFIIICYTPRHPYSFKKVIPPTSWLPQNEKGILHQMPIFVKKRIL